jgi:hypothetical protein
MNKPQPTEFNLPRKREPYTHLRALGAASLPQHFCLDGVEYSLVQTFKHDFFAASGLYQSSDQMVVLKMGRSADFLGLPAAWIGRWLVAREVRFYGLLQDLPGVPKLLGCLGPSAFVHEFVPGHSLRRYEIVSDDFFPGLTRLLAALHERGIAYVDLEKSENIIVGDDGRPYLIDFQISWKWPWRRSHDSWPARWLFRRFAHADRYHLAKHTRRCRPDQMRQDQLEQSRRISPLILLHRTLFRPLTLLRRRVLAHVERVRAAARGRAPSESK